MKTEIKSVYGERKEDYLAFLATIKTEPRPTPAEERMNIANLRNIHTWELGTYINPKNQTYRFFKFSCFNSETSVPKLRHTPFGHEYLGNLRRIISNYESASLYPTFFNAHLNTLLEKYKSVYVFPEIEHEVIIVMCAI